LIAREVQLEKTPRPIIGGILNIIIGSFGLLIAFTFFLLVFIANIDFENYLGIFPDFITAMALFVASVILLLSLLILVSGIYALERRYWGLSLAGSIVAMLTGNLLGIAALVLIAISRDEFDRKAEPDSTKN
jgi:lysylphosphatidylglycerol synthetase-like protein (DUF2156 family)